MAKQYFQAICYTTDHCDGDLIAPSCWEPHLSLSKAADDIMGEINESFSWMLHIADRHPDSLTIEYRNNTNDNTGWDSKVIKNWKRNSKFFDKLRSGLADGTICTVMVTVPEYLNSSLQRIDRRSDVFHINSFTLGKAKPKKTKPKKKLFKKGDVVWVSGDISNSDYNCRVDSQGVVDADQKTARSKVFVTIDYIDGDNKACVLVDPKLLTIK